MKRTSFLKKVTILTVSTLIFTSISPISSLASTPSYVESELTDVKFNTELNQDMLNEQEKKEIVEENPLDNKVLSDEFDLVKETETTPSLQEMTSEEEKLFYEIVDEQVQLAGITNPNDQTIFKDTLINFFNEDSESYNNLEKAQLQLEESIIKSVDENEKSNLVSFLQNATISTFGVETASALSNPFKGKIKVSVKLAGATFNTILGIAIGGGAGLIQSYIIKKGKNEAKKLFTKTVVSRLKAWGAPKLATVVGVSVITALNYLDVGTAIAKEIDKRDSKKKSGYIEIY
ncbi:hypothetical protein [Niallia taxi]|uniref:hypothetical protein n=1 Tax=Niallia taxi TaxID=2499688 RepID=UPI00300BE5A4